MKCPQLLLHGPSDIIRLLSESAKDERSIETDLGVQKIIGMNDLHVVGTHGGGLKMTRVEGDDALSAAAHGGRQDMPILLMI
jgi:hypothetical protein